MSYDIYGQPLRSGYCEAHPQVHEPWPCQLCLTEAELYRQRELEPQGPAQCEGCAGSGREYVTIEMAADAGQPELANSETYCRYCGGSGNG